METRVNTETGDSVVNITFSSNLTGSFDNLFPLNMTAKSSIPLIPVIEQMLPDS